jgi:hypothetical protein
VNKENVTNTQTKEGIEESPLDLDSDDDFVSIPPFKSLKADEGSILLNKEENFINREELVEIATVDEDDVVLISSSLPSNTSQKSKATAKERWKEIFASKKGAAPKPPPSKPNVKIPYYKKIPGSTFYVDAFKYGEISDCTGYFLT